MVFKLLLATAAAATLALAQGGGDTGGIGGMGNSAGSPRQSTPEMGGAPMRAQKETKADQMVNKLKLNKDQKTQFESILEAAVQEARPVSQNLAQARGALVTAYINGKAADDILKQYSDLQAQMTAVEAKAFQKLYELLKPNQTAKAGEAFDLMGGLLDIQAGAAGGRGTGRGRGGR